MKKDSNISEPHKSSIQREESFIYIYICKGLDQNLAI